MRGNLIDDLEQRFDDLRRDLLGEWGTTTRPHGVGALTARVPAVDVAEEDNQFLVTAELPGFEKKDVRLEVDGGGLWVRAYRQESQESPPGARWIRRERSAHAYERYVPLPDEVSPDGVRATFRNGVLEVTVPKTSPEKRRRRSIDID